MFRMIPTPSVRTRPRRFRAYTLMEVLAAGVVTALVIVPSLKLLRQGIDLGDRTEVAGLLTTLCVSKLEEHSALTAATFTEATETGNFAAIGFPSIAFHVQRSDDEMQGGIEARLMTINVTVWEDANGNTFRDSDEAALTLSTKLAKLALYQEQAGGS